MLAEECRVKTYEECHNMRDVRQTILKSRRLRVDFVKVYIILFGIKGRPTDALNYRLG